MNYCCEVNSWLMKFCLPFTDIQMGIQIIVFLIWRALYINQNTEPTMLTTVMIYQYWYSWIWGWRTHERSHNIIKKYIFPCITFPIRIIDFSAKCIEHIFIRTLDKRIEIWIVIMSVFQLHNRSTNPILTCQSGPQAYEENQDSLVTETAKKSLN